MSKIAKKKNEKQEGTRNYKFWKSRRKKLVILNKKIKTESNEWVEREREWELGKERERERERETEREREEKRDGEREREEKNEENEYSTIFLSNFDFTMMLKIWNDFYLDKKEY